MREALVNLGVLFLMAPAARYLAAAPTSPPAAASWPLALHASWNASGTLSVVDGDLQYVIGLAVVAVVALVVDVVRSRSDSGVLSHHRDRHPASAAAAG